MGEYTVKPLTVETWDAFAALCERNNGGGMGNCWCTVFHHNTPADKRAAGPARDFKYQRVVDGTAHAALVFDGPEAVGWCEYGSPTELPAIYHRKEIAANGDPLPDYRLTCLFADRRRRREGVATAALDGALELIADEGGGVVETYPRDTPDQRVSSSFLYNATRELFERAGFTYIRPKGTKNCLMRKEVPTACGIGVWTGLA